MCNRFMAFVTLLLLQIILLSCSEGNPLVPTDEGEKVLGIYKPTQTSTSFIAFTRALKDPKNNSINRELFFMTPNGNHQTRLTFHPADDDYPAWSPRGFAIAFTSNRSSGSYGNHDVFRMNTPSNILQLTDEAWQFNSFATDWVVGMITAAQHNTLIGAPFDLIRITALHPNGAWQKFIDTKHVANYDPCVSRDGKTLVFSARPSGAGYSGNIELYLMDLTTGSEPVRLTYFESDPNKVVYSTDPAFDYSGALVVFQTNLWDDNWEIAYINLASMAPMYFPVRVTQNKADDIEPCWDPTGKWIAFCSNRDGNYEIYKTTLQENPDQPPIVQRLTYTPEDESNPDWGPLIKSAF